MGDLLLKLAFVRVYDRLNGGAYRWMGIAAGHGMAWNGMG